MFRLLFDGKVQNLSFFFQALSMSLAGRVGTGNIAGVATAIALEDPAILMWMVAFGANRFCRSYFSSNL
jgi:AGCS family alanine or glycine:cation symporter